MKKKPIIIIAALTLAALVGGDVGAATAGNAHGRVADPLGEPIPGVQVSNGFESVQTDMDGQYSLPSSVEPTYRIVGTHSSFDPATALVTSSDSTFDLTMQFTVSASVTPDQVQSDQLPTELQIEVFSDAPRTSCVYWSNDDASVQLAYDTDSEKWVGSYEVAAGTPVGIYDYSVVAKSCADAVTLGSTTGSYMVDDPTPSIGVDSSNSTDDDVTLQAEDNTDCTISSDGKTLTFHGGYANVVAYAEDGGGRKFPFLAEGKAEVAADWDAQAFRQQVEAGGSYWPNAHAWTQVRSQLGHDFEFTGGGSNQVDVKMRWVLTGTHDAFAGPAMPFGSTDADATTSHVLRAQYKEGSSTSSFRSIVPKKSTTANYSGQVFAFSGADAANSFSSSGTHLISNVTLKSGVDYEFYFDFITTADTHFHTRSGARAVTDFNDTGKPYRLYNPWMSWTLVDGDTWHSSSC